MSRIAENSGALSLAEVAELYIQSLREDAKSHTDRPDSLAERPTSLKEQQPRVGDLWLTCGTSESPPTLIAISWIGDGFYRAVVVLEEPELAAKDDLLVPAEQCPLGVPVALCSWRDLPVSEADLWQLVGSLPDEIVEPLAMILQHRLTGGFRRRALGSGRLSTREGGVRWVIESTGDTPHSVEYLSGAPILSDIDPRIQVRQELVKLTSYLEERVLQELADVPLTEAPAANVRTTLKKLITAPFEAIVRGVKVERWKAPALGVAGGLPSKSSTRRLVINVPELKELGIRPYVRVDVSMRKNRWQALFLLEFETDPRAPSRDLTPRLGTVEVSVMRPATRSKISVRLGSNRRGDFTTTSERLIEQFHSGEEQNWTVDVAIRVGAQWGG